MFFIFYGELNYLNRFSKNSAVSNVMETCPVTYELFLEEKRTYKQARRS